MSDLLRAGVIGAGAMGVVHSRAIRAAGGTIAAVVGHPAEAGPAAAAHIGAEGWASSVEELVARDDIDVVHICVPNHLHATYALLAIAAAKHVVCEKPIATSVAEARAMTRAADAEHVVAAVPLIYRYYPTVRDARERVGHGDVGRVHTVHGSYLQDWLSRQDDSDWRVAAGLGGSSRAFADIGVHWCDLAEFVTGQRIVRLSAQTSRVYDSRGAGDNAVQVSTEDTAVLQFETDGGATGSAVISQASPGRKNRLWLSVDGTEESVSFDQESPERLVVGTRQHTVLIPRGSSSTSAGAAYDMVPAGHPQGYQDCFNAFVRDTYLAIRGHSPNGLPTFADGLRAALLTEAVLSSAAQRAWVEVLAA